MLKTFVVNVPDEPFKNNFTKNHTCEIKYSGPSFLVLGISTVDNKVRGVEGAFESMTDIDLDTFIDDDTYFVILNAFDNSFEAAYLTHQYTNDEFPSYKETLATGEVYEYFWEKDGILGSIYVGNDLFYDPNKNTYTKPSLITSPINREQYLQTIDSKISMFQKALADNPTWNEDEKSQVQYAIDWYKNIWNVYGNVDFYKIPVPIFPLPDF